MLITIMSYAQWTMWNCTLLVLVISAHNSALWRGKIVLEDELSSAETNASDGVGPFGSGDSVIGTLQSKVSTIPRLPKAMVIDAPWTVHIPKSLMWVLFQLAITVILVKHKLGQSICPPTQAPTCSSPQALEIIGLIVHVGVVWAYFILYYFYAGRAISDLNSLPYAETRTSRMVFGMQQERMLPCFAMFAISGTLLLAVNVSTCWNSTALGVIPLQALGFLMAATLCFFFMPKSPETIDETLQVWLQEFAWTRSEVPHAMSRRNAKLQLAGSQELAAKPMFCLELAIKLLYFSKIVYNINEVRAEGVGAESDLETGQGTGTTEGHNLATPVGDESIGSQPPPPREDMKYVQADEPGQNKLQELDAEEREVVPGVSVSYAKTLFDLQYAETMYEQKSDTKSLLAWGGKTIVLSFRGTASFENAKTDVDVSYTYHSA